MDANAAGEDLHFMELFRLHSVSLTLGDGDTLVFVDYPTSPAGRPPYVDCHGTEYRSQTFRVHAAKLRATGSSRFLDMLGPSHQSRVRRRRGLAATGGLPEGVEFVLDLTPPAEGDDVLFQVARMSLTPSIIAWRDRESPLIAQPRLINGHDDVCSCGGRQVPNLGNQMQPVPPHDQRDVDVDADAAEGPRRRRERLAEEAEARHRGVPDYCPVRHRNSIIRIMMLVEGIDVILDSASRMWSLVAAATILDCAPVIRDKAAQWLMYDSNTRFMDFLPEETLRIAFDLKLAAVAQIAFRVLVYELALELAATPNTDSPHHGAAPRGKTIFGRDKGDLDDELHNMVQHAARALVERTTLLLDGLQDVTKLGVPLGGEWEVLCKMEQALAQEAGDDEDCRAAWEALQSVKEHTAHVGPWMESLSARVCFVVGRSFYELMDYRTVEYRPWAYASLVSCIRVVSELNPVQKLLCPHIYSETQDAWIPDGVHNANRSRLIEALATRVSQYVHRHPRAVASKAWDVFFNDDDDDDDDDDDAKSRSPATLRSPLIRAHLLDGGARAALEPILLACTRHDAEPALRIAHHLLLTLSSEETSFLPLWAGGCDDGTGGVYGDALPPAEMGPSGPGPAYTTGLTVGAPTSTSASLIEGFMGLEMSSTAAGSRDAHDGGAGTSHNHGIIGGVSETFWTEGSEWRAAVLAVPDSSDWEMETGAYSSDDCSTSTTTLEAETLGDGGGGGGEDFAHSDDGSIVFVEFG